MPLEQVMASVWRSKPQEHCHSSQCATECCYVFALPRRAYSHSILLPTSQHRLQLRSRTTRHPRGGEDFHVDTCIHPRRYHTPIPNQKDKDL